MGIEHLNSCCCLSTSFVHGYFDLRIVVDHTDDTLLELKGVLSIFLLHEEVLVARVSTWTRQVNLLDALEVNEEVSVCFGLMRHSDGGESVALREESAAFIGHGSGGMALVEVDGRDQ